MFAVVIVLLLIGLLPMLEVFKCIVHSIYHLPDNMRGTPQAIHQSVSKYFQKVSKFLYFILKNVYAFIYLEEPTTVSCSVKRGCKCTLTVWDRSVTRPYTQLMTYVLNKCVVGL